MPRSCVLSNDAAILGIYWHLSSKPLAINFTHRHAMNSYRSVVTILAFFILIPGTTHHIYLRYFEPRTSVLDKYTQPKQEDIQAAASLDELLKMYDKAHQEGEALRRERCSLPPPFSASSSSTPPSPTPLTPRPPTIAPAPLGPVINDEEHTNREKSLETAIREWESCSRDIFQIKFYWCFGFALVLVGMAIHRFSPWGGLILRNIGFFEMIYWTAPMFLDWKTREADRLLTNKIFLSSLTLLILVIVVSRGWTSRNARSSQAANTTS